MTRNKKRPQYVVEYINGVNKALKAWGIKDENDHLFVFVVNYLIEHKMYEGFNFYKVKNLNGEEKLVLAGTTDKEKFDCLQIW